MIPSRRKSSYIIEFVSFCHVGDLGDPRAWREIPMHEINGYNPDDFAPGFRDLEFPSWNAASKWLEDNRIVDPDICGIGARFCVVKKSR